MLHNEFDLVSSVKSIAPAVLGAAVSAMSVPESVAGLTGLVSASIIGFVAGNALVEVMAVNGESWVAFFLKFSIGVLGLAILRESFKLMPGWLGSLGKRIFGG